ncbi:MAG: DNA primase [Alphaproteobacteria bacterium]|nr:DNA primase [Alphaproteobacteria bacterium]
MEENFRAFLEEIRDRITLSHVIGKSVRLVRAGREYKSCCPFHEEKTPSFYVNDEKKFYHCFGCGAHGDIVGWTMRVKNLNFIEAVESLALEAGLQVPRKSITDDRHYEKEKQLYNITEKAAAWFEEQLFSAEGKQALTYLRGRGLSDEGIKKFHIGYTPASGQAFISKMKQNGFANKELLELGLIKRSENSEEYYSFFRNRIMFPVVDKRGRPIAFGARILGDGMPKYLNSPDSPLFRKGNLLYGLSRARTAASQGHPIIVVEGYMDVISLVESGYAGAVAPLGTALTEAQMETLWKLLPAAEYKNPRIDYTPVLCFDGDEAGVKAAERSVTRALPLLASDHSFRIAKITGAKDPDELIRKVGKTAFDAILKQALPIADMVWQMSLSNRSIRTPEDAGSFLKAIKSKIALINDKELRNLYWLDLKGRYDEFLKNNFGRSDSIKHNTATEPSIVRTLPGDKNYKRERGILAIILNHPEIYDDFAETIGVMEFTSKDFISLRDDIVSYMASHESGVPAPEELIRDMMRAGGSDFDFSRKSLIEEMLNPKTMFGELSGARKEADSEQARLSMNALIQSIEQDKMNLEYEKAKEAFKNNPSEENAARLLSFPGRR